MVKDIKSTTEVFGLSKEELGESKGYGYTKEDNLILDRGLKVNFYSSYNNLKRDVKGSDFGKLEIKEVFKKIDNGYALVLH